MKTSIDVYCKVCKRKFTFETTHVKFLEWMDDKLTIKEAFNLSESDMELLISDICEKCRINK